MTTPLTARDEMTALFTTGWPSAAATIAGQPVPISYDDKQSSRPKADDLTAGTKFWCRFIVQHASGGQTSIGGEDGKARYELDGVVTVQIFCPQGVGRSKADLLGELALSLFRGKVTAGAVRFKNHRLREAGEDGPWSLTLATVEFGYSQHA